MFRNIIKLNRGLSRYYSTAGRRSSNGNKGFSFNSNSVKVGGAIALSALTITGLSTVLLEQEKKEEQVEVNATEEPKKSEKEYKKAMDTDYDIESFKYVIIGGGTAAYYAVDKILENDKEATILIISKERDVPYQRPPLTKNLWQTKDDNVVNTLSFSDWSGKQQNLLYEPESVYGSEILQFVKTRSVIDLHIDEKLVLLNDGKLIRYDKCLIATGGEPRNFKFTSTDKEKITTYRTVEDFKNLYNFIKDGNKHVTILGGGFLGSELTCSLGLNFGEKGIKLAQVFPENGVYANLFPEYLSNYATEEISKIGVDVKTKRLVKDITDNNGRLTVLLDDGSSFDTDHVVVAAGIIPNTDVVKSTTLEIDQVNGGYVVNPELQARTDLFVAGDVASYYDFSLGVRRRVEHHDHARATGELAGNNMSTKTTPNPYTYQPFFWSDLTPGVGFEAVGNTSAKLKTFSVWEKKEGENEEQKYNKGNIYYLNDKNQVVGVLCYGNYGKMDTARRLILKKRVIQDLNELQHAIDFDEHH
ncbi:hypothetical protein DICPUDRAFT_157558 [Dictyostelium purpureum]|uniref:FAD/NAD(P)-binding domain-containing protein n=1 Tax=Dictyostelium purpureum TaxID=5786 RepID=F0ZZF4_DICPU|nr:uncharacterized protein DICPUDRAFT_157558 [Dictyostelium purpureum]EGC30677.1 hypothetical protein DICPUDRAFT_157558 [Dictyostelium purpureum]|eukprot:XP_003292802.1 hypothetical protein DICPUDRAFT_157558 [Dictyostelium purpureum]